MMLMGAGGRLDSCTHKGESSSRSPPSSGQTDSHEDTYTGLLCRKPFLFLEHPQVCVTVRLQAWNPP